MSDPRAVEQDAFLTASGWAGARLTPLAGDASTRRYARLAKDGRAAILMDAPPKAEAGPCPPDADEARRLALGWNAASRLAASRVDAFAAVADYLRGLGLSAPEVYAADAAAGFAVLEDLGDDLFARVIPDRADEATLYAAAGEALALAQSAPPPAALAGPAGPWPLLAFDALALRVNADLFAEWLPQTRDVALSDPDRAALESIRDRLIADALSQPRALILRDYHGENLLWLPAREGVKAVGLLDFQDAVVGPRGWDLSMLLHDARRDVAAAAAAAALGAYVRATGADEAALRREIAVLGALNVMRILGLFARLSVRDKKDRYLAFMPRMWGHLAGVVAHPDLADLRDLLERVAPGRLRSAA